ncbi:MAG: hypothetical protein ACAH83_11550 [Alphaproteobacteria bacterium]
MFDGLKEKWRKSREAKAAKQAVYDAIGTGDPTVTQKALQAASRVEISDEEKGLFVRAAIKSQNLPVFREVVAYTDDPNIEIKYTVSTSDSSKTYRFSPIAYAIGVASTHDISLWLANNPRVNITGEYMDSAKSNGMQDVALVLMKRIADLRRQEAALLDKEAGQPTDPALSAPSSPAAAIAPAAAESNGETWALMGPTSIARVTSSPVINRQLTEIFNFESRERVQITENLKTGVETIGQPEKFDKLAPATIRKAEEMMKSLTDSGHKRSFSL